MTTKVSRMSSFLYRPEQSVSDITSEVNRISGFVKEMTERNIENGMSKYKSKHDNKKK